MLRRELGTSGGKGSTLLTTQDELPFYQSVAKYNPNLTLIAPDQPLPMDQSFIVTRGAFIERELSKVEPAKIVTNGRSDKSDRLYLYKSIEK